jgi:hypothetical protein
VRPVNPPVKFVSGNNANKPGLGKDENGISYKIDVSTYDDTRAEVTIHPTYQKTYYKDVLNITNVDDSKGYNVYIRVNSYSINLPSGSYISLNIYDKQGYKVKTVNLTDPTSPNPNMIGYLDSGMTWIVDIEVSIPEGFSLPSSATANLQLIYTPSSETPP